MGRPPGKQEAPTAKQLAEAKRRSQEAQALPGSAEHEALVQQGKARAARVDAARLAQIINLHIAGYNFEQIGARIGASADEVERLVMRDSARYVRTQPQLRNYLRNWISGKYNDLLEAVIEEATDKNHPKKLEHQDRAVRILKEMTDLHGAAAPKQSEVKIEAAPEAVEQLVKTLSAQVGLDYDADVFDAEVIEDVDAPAVQQTVAQLKAATEQALEVSGHEVSGNETDE